jgi:hypothetical protein
MSNPKPKGENTLPAIELFFDARGGGYLYRINSRFVSLGASDVRMHLRVLGFSSIEWKDGLREIDWPLYLAQTEHLVDYAGALAGHRVGLFQSTSGRAFLVTDEAGPVWEKIPEHFKRPAWFLRFVETLLPDDQALFFCHWLRIALESMRHGDFRPGQVVVLAGPSQSGKSLLQSIVTEVLGGRSANPFRYMMTESQFNYDLAGAEHWQIEDPPSSTDIRTRRLFGAKLKECTVNRDFSIHQKGKDALLLPVFRRVTISVNDEPENLAVIPPLDASIVDKLFLFRCSLVDVGEDRKTIWDTVLAEVPSIRWHLLRNLPALPKELKDARFGVRAWQHPFLLSELSDLSAESRLLGLIDQIIFEDGEFEIWTGKALQLEQVLRKSAFGFDVEKLLRYSSACGVYLSRLAKSNPERISRHATKGRVSWTLKPPAIEENENEPTDKQSPS